MIKKKKMKKNMMMMVMMMTKWLCVTHWSSYSVTISNGSGIHLIWLQNLFFRFIDVDKATSYKLFVPCIKLTL